MGSSRLLPAPAPAIAPAARLRPTGAAGLARASPRRPGNPVSLETPLQNNNLGTYPSHLVRASLKAFGRAIRLFCLLALLVSAAAAAGSGSAPHGDAPLSIVHSATRGCCAYIYNKLS